MLPEWLAGLSQVRARRAVRMTHVLGDVDDVVIGMRFADGTEMTCAVFIDHNMLSEVKDAFFVPASIEAVLDVGAQHNVDSDTSFIEMSLADARAWTNQALERAAMIPPIESDSWPGCRALLRWVLDGLPEGGTSYEEPYWDSGPLSELFAKFFGTASGGPFADYEYRELIELLVESGTGDPLRWSDVRLKQLLRFGVSDEHLSEDCLLDAPDLLRAFVPFAHAESGIRDELTAEALAAIDEMEPAYQAQVLRDA